MGPSNLYNLTFKHANKSQNVIVTAPSPENAQELGAEILEERGFSNWNFVDCTPIRAFITDGKSTTIVQMAEAAGSHK